MNYFALLYEVVDDYVGRRGEFREQHLRVAREARERGELVLGGAFAEPVDRALLVFHVADKNTVEDFARKDPYVVHGLVKKWEARPWSVVVGNENPASSAAVPPGTILRRWSARTSEALLPKYLEHFSKNVIPELLRVNGYLGATVSIPAHRHGSRNSRRNVLALARCHPQIRWSRSRDRGRRSGSRGPAHRLRSPRPPLRNCHLPLTKRATGVTLFIIRRRHHLQIHPHAISL